MGRVGIIFCAALLLLALAPAASSAELERDTNSRSNAGHGRQPSRQPGRQPGHPATPVRQYGSPQTVPPPAVALETPAAGSWQLSFMGHQVLQQQMDALRARGGRLLASERQRQTTLAAQVAEKQRELQASADAAAQAEAQRAAEEQQQAELLAREEGSRLASRTRSKHPQRAAPEDEQASAPAESESPAAEAPAEQQATEGWSEPATEQQGDSKPWQPKNRQPQPKSSADSPAETPTNPAPAAEQEPQTGGPAGSGFDGGAQPEAAMPQLDRGRFGGQHDVAANAALATPQTPAAGEDHTVAFSAPLAPALPSAPRIAMLLPPPGSELPGLRAPLALRLPTSDPQLPALKAAAKLREFERGNKKKKLVALTFDDGPHPQFTAQLLATLDYYDIPATFFVVGQQAQKYPQWVKMAHQQGCEIANHTYDHFRLPRLPKEEQEYQLDECSRVIGQLTGELPRFMRPPGGQYDDGIEALAHQRGMVTALWDVALNDTGEGMTSGRMHDTAMREIRAGSIVLAHDGIQATVDMLPQLISTLKDKGYEFVTLSELAREL